MACRLTAMFMACRTSCFTKGTFGSSLSGRGKVHPAKLPLVLHGRQVCWC